MDAKQFLVGFNHIANAPRGILRLRELVLHLAVAGDLTRDVTPVDASPLIDAIAIKKAEHLDRRKVVKMQAHITNDEVSAPHHWATCRLGDLVLTMAGGGTPSKNYPHYWNGSIPWASVKDLKDLKYLDDTEDHITDEGLMSSSSNLIPSNRIIICTRMGLGKVVINRVPIAINQDLKALELPPEVDPHFFLVLYKTLKFRGKGTTVSGIRQDQLLSIPVALPPVEEQHHIVAKVDDLMALCEKLEAQQQSRRQIQNALRKSTLQAFAAAQSPHELQAAWARLEANFSRLFSEPGDVDEFIAEFKNMAVRGLLELPSTTLTDTESIKSKCDELRSHYISSGLLRCQKIIGAAESKVIYPRHWAIVPFDEVAIVIGGVTKGRDLRNRETLTCPYLAVANVQRGFFKLQNLKTIQIPPAELEKYLVQKGDLLITEGGDWDKVGRTAIWRGGVENCLHQNHVFKARVPSELLMDEWVELVLNSGIGRDYFASASKQTTNLASINMMQLRRFPIPIPPLDEQQRILEKLDSLTATCHSWRQFLQKKYEMAAVLAEAIVATFTGIVQREDEPMKAPQTELIAPLQLGTTPEVRSRAPLATLLSRHDGEMSARDLWQRFGGEIDDFYVQLKAEVAHGWIKEPSIAEVREKPSEVVLA